MCLINYDTYKLAYVTASLKESCKAINLFQYLILNIYNCYIVKIMIKL